MKLNKHIKKLLLYATVLCCGSLVGSPTELWQRANDNYEQGEYETAIENYLELLDQGLSSPELFYNLGNCYYKTYQIGLSILHYEKALLLKPHDKNTKNNLKLANKLITDKIEALPEIFILKGIRNIANVFTLKHWQVICISSIWVCLVLLILGYLIKKIKPISQNIAIVLFFASVLSLSLMYAKYQYDKNNRFAIIITPNVYVKNTPNVNSEDAFILHEGTKVKLLQTINEYQEIKLADGNVGWIEANTLAKI